MLSKTVIVNSILSDTLNVVGENLILQKPPVKKVLSTVSSCSECDSTICKCPCTNTKRITSNQIEIKIPREIDSSLLPNNIFDRKSINFAGLIYTVTNITTDKKLNNLLNYGIRILHIQMANGTKDELNLIIIKIRTAISKFHLESNYKIPVSLGIEISGRIIRAGRLRNNQSIKLIKNHEIILTCNLDYRNCSNENVLFLANFHNYIPLLQIGNYIFINNYKIQLKIVKIKQLQWVTCCIVRGSILKSYMIVTLPYHIPIDKEKCLPTICEMEDCQWAVKNKADFVIIPSVTDVNHFQCINTVINSTTKKVKNNNIADMDNESILILGNIDTCYLKDKCSLISVLKSFDGVWIDKFSHEKQTIISLTNQEQYIIEKTRQLKKPIIIKMLNFFAKYVAQDGTNCKKTKRLLLYEPDCFILARNFSKTNINLINNYCQSIIISELDKEKNDKNNEIITKCAVKTATLLDGKLIVCLSGHKGENAIYLSYQRPMCPIVCITINEYLARKLTIWKNVLPIVYLPETKKIEPKWKIELENQLQFGIKYGRELKVIITGDLVIFGFNGFSGENLQHDINSVRLIYIENY